MQRKEKDNRPLRRLVVYSLSPPFGGLIPIPYAEPVQISMGFIFYFIFYVPISYFNIYPRLPIQERTAC